MHRFLRYFWFNQLSAASQMPRCRPPRWKVILHIQILHHFPLTDTVLGSNAGGCHLVVLKQPVPFWRVGPMWSGNIEIVSVVAQKKQTEQNNKAQIRRQSIHSTVNAASQLLPQVQVLNSGAFKYNLEQMPGVSGMTSTSLVYSGCVFLIENFFFEN